MLLIFVSKSQYIGGDQTISIILHPIQSFGAQLLAIVLNFWLDTVRIIELVILAGPGPYCTRVYKNLDLEFKRKVG